MEKINWAPKVRQNKIWQVYQNDAQGMVDEALLAEVGCALFQRCRSVALVTHRQVECPRCGTVFQMGETDPWRVLPGPHICPTPGCGWETTAEEWHTSWRHRDLLGTAAESAFAVYMRDYPRARTPEERMLCIDQLIHAFHISLRTGQIARSFANNLIEGSHDQVLDLLDRLFERPNGVDKEQWRANRDEMNRRRKGQA